LEQAPNFKKKPALLDVPIQFGWWRTLAYVGPLIPLVIHSVGGSSGDSPGENLKSRLSCERSRAGLYGWSRRRWR